jgi:hypothetical protein
MKTLLNYSLLIYSGVLVVTFIIAIICKQYWPISTLLIGLLYSFYCSQTIRYKIINKSYSMYDGVEYEKVPKAKYKALYLTSKLNYLLIATGLTGFVFLFI